MNNIDTSQLLTQLRAAAAAARNTPAETPAAAEGVNFTAMLRESIGKVNELQQTSAGMKDAFTMGDPSVSLADTMIAMNKASLGFQMMVQTRNKLVEAYQEIMRMQV